MERGFLYAATGERWVRESARSVARLKGIHPDIPAVLFTDLPEMVAGAPFDDVVSLPERDWVRSEAKVWAVGRSPFERTVYLDTDTHVIGDVSDLFAVLDRFDVAAAPFQLRVFRAPGHADPDDIPDAFQSVNGGMLAYRRNERTRALLELWWELYQADKATTDKVLDQPSLRVALWRSPAGLLHVPPELNMRTIRYRAQPVTAVGPVRLIHGRVDDVDALARRWNSTTRLRLLTPLTQYQARAVFRFVVPDRLQARVRSTLKPWIRRFAGGD